MFTGLVQAVGQIVAQPDAYPDSRSSPATPPNQPLRLLVDAGSWKHHPSPGDSISVSGCCLTLAAPLEATGGRLAFDVVPETLDKTCLGAILARPDPARRRVNLEHAVTASTLMGGHFVQGHVDGVGRVDRITTTDGWRVRVRPPANLMPYLVPKGSMCVDGVSLTIAALGNDETDSESGKVAKWQSGEVTPASAPRRSATSPLRHSDTSPPTWFEVALIPTTLELTTLGSLAPGDPVNLEADILAKTIVHYLRHFNSPLV